MYMILFADKLFRGQHESVQAADDSECGGHTDAETSVE